MSENVFVGREQELGALQRFLDTAAAGHGQVVFVTGEAGAGKTALLREFARRAESLRSDLVSAVGDCNAQTGIGDPYLPFREILALLTGDVEAKLAQGAITQENATRLRALVQFSGQVLVEMGPVLINTFVPGTVIMTTAAKFLAKKVGWLDKMEKLNEGKPASASVGGEDQSHLFEQYTDVLKALAAKQPLVLVADDLQWADAGSVSLLFHLARRIGQSRIFVVGTYRPDEVALGRTSTHSAGQAERHPLEKVVAELKRYNGDIEIDLDSSSETASRHFVDAFLDTEPNRLGKEFRDALFQHTGGLALFTVELLRTLQERGDLRRDDQGRWIEGRPLDWSALPARVEGVVEERIGRLEEESREILGVASVEGEDFTAQVIARVQELRERQLLHQLSEELEKRHHLIHEQGEIEVGSEVLSRYEFTHALFQRYLYNGLSAGERRLLHREVAQALEELYAGHTDEITLQLARHYAESGDAEMAALYLIRAGDMAARVYAHAEARVHFARALDALARLSDTEEHRRQRVDTLTKYVSVSLLAAGPEQSLERLRQAEALLEHLNGGAPDRLRLARVYYRMGQAYVYANRMREAIQCMERVLPIAQELNDADLIATSALVEGRAIVLQGRYGRADALLSQSLKSLQQVENWNEWILASALHALAVTMRGRYAEGIAEGHRAVERATTINSLTGIGQSQGILALLYLMGGDLTQALEHVQLGLDAATQSGNELLLYNATGVRAWAHARQGDWQVAEQEAAQAQALGERIGGQLIWSQWFATSRAEIALGQNRAKDALTLAEQAGNQAQAAGDIFVEGWARRVQGQTEARLERWEDADAHMAESLRLLEEGDAVLEAARTHVAWGILCRDRGDLSGARQHFEKAAAQFQVSGLERELEETRNLIAGVHVQASDESQQAPHP